MTWQRSMHETLIRTNLVRRTFNVLDRQQPKMATLRRSKFATWVASHKMARIPTSIIMRRWFNIARARTGLPTLSGDEPALPNRAFNLPNAAVSKKHSEYLLPNCIRRTTWANSTWIIHDLTGIPKGCSYAPGRPAILWHCYLLALADP